MQNYKIDKNLVGDEHWPNIASVFVQGITDQKTATTTDDVNEREKIIQDWHNIAVMQVTSEKPVEFFIGFLKKNTSQYLNHQFTTDLKFGMRIGPEDVNFLALPLNFKDNLNLELIEITTESNSKYENLLLI